MAAALAATRVAMTLWQGQDTPTALDELIDQAFDELASGHAAPAQS